MVGLGKFLTGAVAMAIEKGDEILIVGDAFSQIPGV